MRILRCLPVLLLLQGCVSDDARVGVGAEASRPGPAWAFFEPAPADVWTRKIDDWQVRQRHDAPIHDDREAIDRTLVSEYALLRDKSDAFQLRERRALASRIVAFSQAEARRHFNWDPETDLEDDPWPTSLELYAQNGDDCDGLDLIAYDLLRAFRFPEEELFRVVVRRDHDGANHMATLWFESRDDPWVLDATGAITRRMRRFSELPGWTPIRVFDEDEVFEVRPVER